MRASLAEKGADGLIIVTQPGTTFTATFGKDKLEPNLLLLAETMDPKADRDALNQFRDDAFIAAIRKARELGWLV
jgi:hypothetical protein